jgi:hypothetical protein
MHAVLAWGGAHLTPPFSHAMQVAHCLLSISSAKLLPASTWLVSGWGLSVLAGVGPGHHLGTLGLREGEGEAMGGGRGNGAGMAPATLHHPMSPLPMPALGPRACP